MTKSSALRYVPATCAAVVWFCAGTYSGCYADPPAMVVPTTAAPAATLSYLNAYDDFMAAGKMIKDDQVIMTGEFDPSSPPVKLPNGIVIGTPIDINEQDRLVDENVPSLERARVGFQHPYQCPVYDLTSAEVSKCYMLDRHLGILFAWQGDVFARSGDYDAAVNSSLDAMKLGVHIGNGGGLLACAMGRSCTTNGRRSIWPRIARLDQQETAAVLTRLEGICGERLPLYVFLAQDVDIYHRTLLHLFESTNWPAELAKQLGYQGDDADRVAYLMQMTTNVVGKDKVISDNSQFLNAEVAITKLPYPLAIKKPLPDIPPDGVNSEMFQLEGSDGVLPFYCNDRTEIARLDMLLIQVALQSYHVANGQYPTSLSDLCPNYLSKLPTDPFTLGKEYRYRLTGDTYLLYSVGPDGVDDGGKGIGKSERGKPVTQMKGDIVAGVPMYQ